MKALFIRSNICKQVITCFLCFIIINSAVAQFEEQTGIVLPNLRYSSMAWGDYNNDGFMDLLVTGEMVDNNYTSRIYKNNGDGTFTEQNGISLIGVVKGSVAWGDYNNDNYLDILLTGEAKHEYISKIYKNNRNGTFTEQTEIKLTGVHNSAVAWGDYNNDGKLDILLTGHEYNNNIPASKIYRNNGDGTFSEQTDIILKGIEYGSVTWGDYNKDGFPDIFMTGRTNQTEPFNPVTKIYKNQGNGTFFEETGIVMPNLDLGSIVLGDYNSDGFLDILIAGNKTSGGILGIYKNNGNETFTEQTTFNYTDTVCSLDIGDYDNNGFQDILLTSNSSDSVYIYKNNGNELFESEPKSLPYNRNDYAKWINFNNDGRLDILIMKGLSNVSSSGKIYANKGIYQINTPPSPPTNLVDSLVFNSVILEWNKSTDVQTIQNGLTYNIRVGSTSGGSDIVSPMASLFNGYLTFLREGNAGHTNNYILNNLSAGTYFWSVQSIDNSFEGGPWSEEREFTITSEQASNLLADSIGFDQIRVSWKNGSGDKRVVFVARGEISTPASPINNVTYNPDSTSVFLASYWHCIYNGTGNHVKITNLLVNNSYSFCVFEYTGEPGNEKYNTSTFKENILIVKTKNFFEEETGASLIGLKNSSIALGDYDNDGFLDILMHGDSGRNSIVKPMTIIYKNNGNDTYTEQTGISISKILNGSVAWGDYNNDSWLDFAVTGDTGISDSPVTKIYKNNGTGNFTELPGIRLKGARYGSLAWFDFNNDGLLDLCQSGNAGNYSLSRVYKNNGNDRFSEQSLLDSTVTDGSILDRHTVSIGDYNNDGFKDILLTFFVFIKDSYSPLSPYLCKIYKNNGDGTFSKQTELTGEWSSYSIWCDYNNDGFLDFIFGNLLYKNNGNGTFSAKEKLYFETSDSRGVISMGDYDNNGYSELINLTPNVLYTGIFRITGDTFSPVEGYSLPFLRENSLASGDFDHDGYLDILITGVMNNIPVTKIYKNKFHVPNTPPTAPVNLRQLISYNNITLQWDKATDGQTNQNALNYNIRIGTTSGSDNVMGSMASNINGFRRIPVIGNASQKTDTFKVNLPSGTYYWNVQAIDNAFSGGPWSTANTFTIVAQQTTNIAADSIGLNGMKLTWTNGNGNKRIIFICEGNKKIPLPVNNTTYQANNDFTAGTLIDTSGWHCVYNGNGNQIIVKGLSEATSYKIAVFEYTGDLGKEEYNTSIGTGNILLTRTKLSFEEQIQVKFWDLIYDAAWVDFDRDNLLDVFVAEKGMLKTFSLLKNMNHDTFQRSPNKFVSSSTSEIISWQDFDNDNRADLSLLNKVHQISLYKNNTDGIFSRVNIYQDEMNCLPIWGDFNNDGILDLLLVYSNYSRMKVKSKATDTTYANYYYAKIQGGSYSGSAVDYNNDGYLDLKIDSKIFLNKGEWNFIENTTAALPNGPDYWCDYDNDGFTDLLANSQIYKNNGDGNFTKQSGIVFRSGFPSWGDYNNDGFSDLFIGSKIFKNNGDNTFTEQKNIELPNEKGTWADYNNDGYLDLYVGHKLFKNNGVRFGIPSNTPPSAPENLKYKISSDTIILSWDKSTDSQTSQNGLSYNIRMGTVPGGTDVISPLSSGKEGFRYILAMGNKGQATNIKLVSLPEGTYYWSVQAIDNAFAGSLWSIEQTFSISSVGFKGNKAIDKINFYPNPAKNHITIVNEEQRSFKISIMDLNGKELKVQQVTSNDNIYLNGLPSGIYIIKLQNKDETIVRRLVIE